MIIKRKGTSTCDALINGTIKNKIRARPMLGKTRSGPELLRLRLASPNVSRHISESVFRVLSTKSIKYFSKARFESKQKMPSLNWKHHALIQALMTRGPLKEKDFHAIFSGLTGKSPGFAFLFFTCF